MASYKTDPGFIASTFKPYVQQMPIDEMVAVGMEKQRRYDEGIQKIQTNIDNIAGLDIARGIDRKYLQSKLNSLGNNLKFVAAGDFSDSQLVNSVGGMVKQIGKDAYIKAAVSSTANDRNQIQQMEDDRKAGKLTPHAEHYYNMKRQAYYSNNNLKGADGKPIIYSGKYIESWDIDKEMQDAIKAVGDSKWSYDQIFEMDPITKRPVLGADGRPKYSSYATRMIKEGKFNQNVAAAIDGVISRPEARQELTMRGVYNYRGITDIGQFEQMYRAEGERRKELLNNHEDNLKNQYMQLGDDDVSRQQKEQIMKSLNDIENERTSVDQQTEKQVNDANQFGSLEGLKGSLETMKMRNNYMISGVTEKMSQQIIENIPYNKQQDKIKADWDVWKMKQDVAISQGNLNVRRAMLPYQIENLKATAEHSYALAAKARGETKAPPGAGEPGTKIEAAYEQNDFNATNDFFEAQKENSDNLTKGRFDFVVKYATARERVLKPKDGMTEQQIKEYFAKKGPDFIRQSAEKYKTELDKNKHNKNFTGLVSSLDKLHTLEGVVNDDYNETKRLESIAKTNYKGFDSNALKNLSKGNIGSYEITYKKGGVMGGPMFGTETTATLTPGDIADMKLAQKVGVGRLFGALSSDDDNRIGKDAEDRFVKKFGVLPSTVLNMFTNRNSKVRKIGSGGGDPFRDFGNDYNTISNRVTDSKFVKSTEAMGKAIKDRNTANKNFIYSPYPKGAKETERKSINDAIDLIVANRSGTEASDALAGFEQLYKKEGNTPIVYKDNNTRDGSPKFYLQVKKADNTLTGKVEITPDEAATIPTVDIKRDAASQINYKFIRNNGQSTNSRTGSVYDPGASSGAFVPASHFEKRLNTTRIKGADAVPDENGGFNAVFYIKDKDGNEVPIIYKDSPDKVYPHSFPSLDAMNTEFFEKLSPAHVQQILNLNK